MSALSMALEVMQAEVTAFAPGTKTQPKERTTDWFLLRAKAAGLAYLQRVEQLGIAGDAGASERLYKAGSRHFKAAEVPAAPEIVREQPPRGISVTPL